VKTGIHRERIRWTGRVQGVGFRRTVADLAETMPITGWVRNEPDGSVICIAEGQREVLQAFIDGIQHVMGRGIESALRQADTEEKQPFDGFHIKFGPDSRR
jgi:acylphosphatase